MTRKTFKIAGTTHDTCEPYVATMGFEVARRLNAFGGGSHPVLRMVTLSTEYTDEPIDRAAELIAKAEAKAQAQEACDLQNAFEKATP